MDTELEDKKDREKSNLNTKFPIEKSERIIVMSIKTGISTRGGSRGARKIFTYVFTVLHLRCR